MTNFIKTSDDVVVDLNEIDFMEPNKFSDSWEDEFNINMKSRNMIQVSKATYDEIYEALINKQKWDELHAGKITVSAI